MVRSIQELSPAAALGLRGVFTDIDGTLTRDGKLTADAYLALWRLKAAGLWVVPVTGRPAGWCDLMARQWPIDGVVGENGALAFYEVDGHMHRFYHPEAASGDAQQRLAAVRDAVLLEVPHSRVAKDQPFRMFDLAIDFSEEAPDLGLEAASRIQEIFEWHGAHAKVSSIHVNGWFGGYDKLAMVRLFAAKVWGLELESERERFLFCGDSPNDEPMFEFFSNSCGVSNISAFAGRMAHLPRYVAARPGGEGFAEIADMVLSRRGEAM